MENVYVNQLSEQSRMWVSSSPKGQFLMLGKKQSTNYLIYNALGKVEVEGTLHENRRIDINILQRGIYFIQFLFADQTQVTRQFMKV